MESLLEPREDINYNVIALAYVVAAALCAVLFGLQGVVEAVEGWWIVVRRRARARVRGAGRGALIAFATSLHHSYQAPCTLGCSGLAGRPSTGGGSASRRRARSRTD